MSVAVLELPFAPDPEQAYRELFAGEPGRFWLDSGGRGRFSYLGSGAEHVEYRVADGTATVTGPTGARRLRQPFFGYLDEQLRRRRVPAPTGLPFAFTLGYVGYLGYELKAETGGAAAHEAPTPDAALVLADRMLAVDHRDGRAWLLTESTVDRFWLEQAAARLAGLDHAGGVLAGLGAAFDLAAGPPEPSGWLAGLGAAPDLAAGPPEPSGRLVELRPGAGLDLAAGPPEPSGQLVDATDVPWLVPRHHRDAYVDRVRACLAAIAAGDSYELCLTNELTAEADVDPAATYAALRRISPVSNCPVWR